MDYHVFRAFADSWFLLGMVLFFIGAILWPWRPGAGRTYEDTASIPFRNEDRPAPVPSRDSAARSEEIRT